MPWTKEQKRVIEDRNSSILVSAAAGSGKTAVLVERILSKILDESDPKNIDQFLVVTFTKAAAAQMKEKISNKLEEMLKDNPDNQHLIKQTVLVNRADITTIDSFCLRLVKEHFSLLDMDSNINIGDNGMMELLKNDVLDEMFKEGYEKCSDVGDENVFTDLMDIFCGDEDEDNLRENILKIYKMASSFSEPEKWLESAKEVLTIETPEEFQQLPWVKETVKLIRNTLKDAMDMTRRGLEICQASGGPGNNYEICIKDREIIQNIMETESFDEMFEAFNIKWPRLKSCKKDEYNQELVEQYKTIRDEYKSLVKSVNIIKENVDSNIQEIKHISKYLIALIDMVSDFQKRYMELKKKRKLMEFSDITHLAYKLVCKGYDENKNPVPTSIGTNISQRYEEIFIDEYQDSNFLQEDILSCVSGLSRGKYNMFMVGDVKQSIYRFRMARPDLFIKKYNTFSDAGNEVKIELKNNFRSRKEVLDATNYFFYQFMGEDLGGIDYNSDIALVATKDYCDIPDEISEIVDNSTEVLVIDSQREEGFGLDDEGDNIAKLELEARVIAERIKTLVNCDRPHYIFDEEQEIYRPANYKDIVILTRSIKGFGEILYDTLTLEGIPVYLEEPKGYFDATEIRVIMSLLAVVDNSRQDIPLAAVLLSPMGEIDEDELAIINHYAVKNLSNKADLYEKCICFIEDNLNSDDNKIAVTASKLNNIMNIIRELKEIKRDVSISELIWKALDMTGYYYYAMAMPQGERRKSNINMLLEKAREFEDGYYKGLFNFLRYVQRLKVNDVDFGEASVVSENENVVRIISMHKSKGLEYPIVFVSGLGRQFNTNDYKELLILHSDFYLASMYVDTKNRYKKDTTIRDCFKILLKRDSIAEEFRVLYVAMTRAREKLILTGCEKNINGILDKFQYLKHHDRILLPYSIRQNQKNFMQHILAAMVRYEEICKQIGISRIIKMRIYSYEDVMSVSGTSLYEKSIELEELKAMTNEVSKDSYYHYIKSNIEYEYPFEAFTSIKSKMSISEIKKLKAYDGNQYEIDEQAVASAENDLGHEEGLTGAQRGTIVHKFMELFPFQLCEDEANEDMISEYAKKLCEEKIFNNEEMMAINSKKIAAMVNSSLGKRMVAASKKNNLFKEQQFSVGIPVNQIYDELKTITDDVVIVQGIIDAFFYEDDDIVLMDYKTDRATKEDLLGRYRAQLDYYAVTLEKLTGKKVKEKIIYSFFLNEEIAF